jgi:hypothetical protein
MSSPISSVTQPLSEPQPGPRVLHAGPADSWQRAPPQTGASPVRLCTLRSWKPKGFRSRKWRSIHLGHIFDPRFLTR